MRAVLAITAKDLRQRLRDRSAYMFGIIIPLGLAVLFGLVVPGFGDGEVSLEVGVVDLDDGDLAGTFRSVLETADVITGVEDLSDVTAAEAAVDGGDLDAAFVLPEGLSGAPTSPVPVTLRVVVDPDRAVDRLVATSVAESFAQRVDTTAVAVALVAASTGGPPDEATVGRVASLVAEEGPAVTIRQGATDDDQLDPTTYLAAGMAVFFLFFTVQFGVVSLLEERDRGTLSRLNVAPIRPGAVYQAKVLTSVALGLVSMTVLVVATTVLLDARWGDPLGVALLVGCGVVAASATVAVVSAVARTAEQASTWQAVIGIVLGMLGGSFFPLSAAPDWLAQLQRLSPHYWFLDGLGQLTGGGDPADALPAAAALLAFGMVAAAAARIAIRRVAA